MNEQNPPSLRNLQISRDILAKIPVNTEIDFLGRFKNDAIVVDAKGVLLAKAFLNRNSKGTKQPEYPYISDVVMCIRDNVTMDYQKSELSEKSQQFITDVLALLNPILTKYSKMPGSWWIKPQKRDSQRELVEKYFNDSIQQLIDSLRSDDKSQWAISFADRYYYWEWLKFVSSFLSELGVKSIFLTGTKDFLLDLASKLTYGRPPGGRYEGLDDILPGWGRGRLDRRNPNRA